MRVFLASDHAGFHLKEKVRLWLSSVPGVFVEDCGNHVYDPKDDYPDFVSIAAKRVANESDLNSRAIVFGFSGTGEAICANRFDGVRACVVYGPGFLKEPVYGLGVDDRFAHIKMARMHNDANVLSIGAGFVDFGFARSAIEVFLKTEFSGDGRHVRRVMKLDKRVVSDVFRDRKTGVIVPAVIPKLYDELEGFVKDVKDYVEVVQIDVVDGVAVSNKGFPFSEGGVGFEKLPFVEEVGFEVDLMVYRPELIVERFVVDGVVRVVVHVAFVEDFDLLFSKVMALKEKGVEFGICFSGVDDVEALFHRVSGIGRVFDYVQVMGISSIGFQGQGFDPSSLSRILFARSHFGGGRVVQVDGGVNPVTISRFAGAGASRFVVGSFIKSSPDAGEAILELLELL